MYRTGKDTCILQVSGKGRMGDFLNAIADCTRIEVGEGITSIGNMEFGGSGLRTVTLPDGIQKIGDYFFSNCSELVIIRLGKI